MSIPLDRQATAKLGITGKTALGALLPMPLSGQEPECKISSMRGAALPGGADGVMQVVNKGRPCGFSVYENPARQRNPGAEGEVVVAPKHGKIEIVPPRIQYTPEAAYAGEDSFVVQMWTAGTKVVLLKFNMTVTVQPPG